MESFHLCPFCASPLDDGRETSRDHIFGKAFGGRVTVPCCRDCNSFIGHDVEGLLHAPKQLVGLRSSRSWTSRETAPREEQAR
ncbi:MAG: hypothetical protein H0W21_00990 [Actinobacteria bacterium]|nr:hypothetical protein [Actinomycetota bacterium]